MPDHLKKILYLDAPDLIIECDSEPILAIEITSEAGTGHNVFQRFSRIAAAAESGVPSVYIYPRAVWVAREKASRWDGINPAVFFALEKLMQIFDNMPALLFYYPSLHPKAPVSFAQKEAKGLLVDLTHPSLPDSSSQEMRVFFSFIDTLISYVIRHGIPGALKRIKRSQIVSDRRIWMQSQMNILGYFSRLWSPETAVEDIPTENLLRYLSRFFSSPNQGQNSLLRRRDRTIIYKVNANFRGDPYPGVLAALDYMKCRSGPTYEDREKNLVLAWGETSIDPTSGQLTIRNSGASIEDYISKVRGVRNEGKCILNCQNFAQVRSAGIPRYFMQSRYGCSFTKPKEIRVYSYFADAILFHDGALWREE